MTLPRKYHKKIKSLKTIYNAKSLIKEGYEIFMRFFNLFKTNYHRRGKQLLYFKVYERHESGLIHLHILFYFPKVELPLARKQLRGYQKKLGLGFIDVKKIYSIDSPDEIIV